MTELSSQNVDDPEQGGPSLSRTESSPHHWNCGPGLDPRLSYQSRPWQIRNRTGHV